MRGVRTEGPMAPDIALDKQRSAEYTYNKEVAIRLDQIGGRGAHGGHATASAKTGAASAAAAEGR
jgi:hypothetical protein